MKIGEKAKAVLSAVAPTLATAFGGPLAGAAVATIMKQFGAEGPKDLEQQIVAADPNTLLKLKEAEQQFLLQMEQLGIQKEQLVYQDLADARKTYRETKDRLVPWIGAGTVVGFFAIVGMTLYGEFKVDSAILGALIGYVSAKADMVLAFYFGSSKGSKEKTEALVEALKGNKNG